ncbi:MAG: HAD family phosphatase [Desulfobulbaceae bacterium]|nr:HAD family phosphatase [Desulfobulbaceae bacterium]HIJ79155.1 HAD family phosphatase [Deltaproteobacteria bacterium]
MSKPQITTVLFDYGGVLAEEGYQQGLFAIARDNGLEPESFFNTTTEIIYNCGFVTGKSDEGQFWRLVREKTGISGDDATLTAEILSRFQLRPQMIDTVKKLRALKINTIILSDQTDWLDRLEQRDRFFHNFDKVFNSYHLGKTKRDPTLFTDTLQTLSITADQALFVDDNSGHIDRADALGLNTHLFCEVDSFLTALADHLPAGGRRF